MEELAKNAYVQLGGFGGMIALLIYLHMDNRKKISELIALVGQKDTQIAALNERFVSTSIQNATAMAQAVVSNAAANEKVADELSDLRRAVAASGKIA